MTERRPQTTEDFTVGMAVIIRDYDDPAYHDARAGEHAVVTGIYNGAVSVRRGVYVERFVPSRLTIVRR